MRLLLHACCGPCAIEPLEALRSQHEVTLLYSNPNIHPLAEYRRRRDTLARHAQDEGVELLEGEYEPALWLQATARLAHDQPGRCRICHRLRLDATAAMAADLGFDGFATTLTVSPYQDQDSVRSAGEGAARRAGLEYLHADFRPRYRAAVERSKALGMYRQRYCGCLLSEVEAEEARSHRRR